MSTAKQPCVLDPPTHLAKHITHANEGGRWDDRAPADAVAPETAWEQAHDVGRLRLHDHFDGDAGPPDEVRVYHADWWSMVFLRLDNRVVTCYRVSSVYDDRLRGELFAAGGDRDE